MITINQAYAGCVFGALWGLGDVPEVANLEVLVHGDVPNKNEKLRCIFYTYVIPYVRAWDAESLEQGKLAMQYALTFEPEKMEDLFDAFVPPCDAPEPATLIFEWVWEALFPGESWLLDRSEEIDVVQRSEGVDIKFDPNVKIPSPMIGQEYSDFQPKLPPT